MSRNSGVKVRSGITDTRTNKPCRSCGVLMDDAGAHFVCLACGYRLEKDNKPASGEVSAWQKQVADLHSQKFITARQAQNEQLLSGFGPLRVLLFAGVLALGIVAPLQNLLPLVNGGSQGPNAIPTAVAAIVAIAVAGWAAFTQAGPQRMLQRNVLAALALAALLGLVMSGPIGHMLTAQYGAMHNGVDLASGVANRIAQTPVWWQPLLQLGGNFAAFGLLAFICHREATDRMY